MALKKQLSANARGYRGRISQLFSGSKINIYYFKVTNDLQKILKAVSAYTKNTYLVFREKK
jgi:hypothetical protein